MQKVKIAVKMSGCYAAWHETSIRVLYDYTNEKVLDSSKEEADELVDQGHDGEYSDTEMKDGILLNGKYYIPL